jgi:hypothetical protein
MRHGLLMACFLFAALLSAGCISFGERAGNVSNNTTEQPPPPLPDNGTPETNMTPPPPPPPPQWERFTADSFSFEYPINMEVQKSSGASSGIFSGSHEEGGQTFEVMVVTYLDTEAVYGKNKDEIYKDNPTKAASDLLIADKKEDPAGSLLSKASSTGELTTFAIARDGSAAQLPFKVVFSDSNKTYSGYAIDLYVPERSLLVRFRVIALDPDRARGIRDNFILSFRLE